MGLVESLYMKLATALVVQSVWGLAWGQLRWLSKLKFLLGSIVIDWLHNL